MLKIAEESDFKRLKQFCKDSIFGTYICCRAEAYGFSSSFSKLWIGENVEKRITCAISSLFYLQTMNMILKSFHL